MGRVPCCEKMGLKKGPWSKEEDRILIDYINQHGHRNWRALPKLAGLLRCGKSCRLRWTNYLRPDIKRGNFSKEEEDTILELHRELGNKWSAIAAKLPGRTDNEIKNVWHTHLKKRLKQSISETKSREYETLVQVVTDKFDCQDLKSSSAVYVTEQEEEEQDINTTTQTSPPHPSSSITDTTLANSTRLIDEHPDLNQDFWPEVVSSQCQPDKINHHGIRDSDYSARGDAGTGIMLPLSPALDTTADQDCGFKYSSSTTQVETDFWCDLFTITDQEISELLEFSKYN